MMNAVTDQRWTASYLSYTHFVKKSSGKSNVAAVGAGPEQSRRNRRRQKKARWSSAAVYDRRCIK
jgi:hypothetical protein